MKQLMPMNVLERFRYSYKLGNHFFTTNDLTLQAYQNIFKKVAMKYVVLPFFYTAFFQGYKLVEGNDIKAVKIIMKRDKVIIGTDVYVEPGSIGKGIGITIMFRFAELAKSQGFDLYMGLISKENKASLRVFIDKLGFNTIYNWKVFLPELLLQIEKKDDFDLSAQVATQNEMKYIINLCESEIDNHPSNIIELFWTNKNYKILQNENVIGYYTLEKNRDYKLIRLILKEQYWATAIESQVFTFLNRKINNKKRRDLVIQGGNHNYHNHLVNLYELDGNISTDSIPIYSSIDNIYLKGGERND